MKRMARFTSARNVKKLSEILSIVRAAKRRGLKIVTTNGAFDILHIGHVRNLEFAGSQGDILIVGVNSDKSVRSYKDKNRPIILERERAEIVAAMKSVDYVFIFKEKTPIPWLKKLKPDVHVKGGDRTMNQIIEKDILKKIGAKFVFAPFTKGRSSTDLIERISRIKKNL